MLWALPVGQVPFEQDSCTDFGLYKEARAQSSQSRRRGIKSTALKQLCPYLETSGVASFLKQAFGAFGGGKLGAA